MAKMLEYRGRYIRYIRETGEFKGLLLDPKIVQEAEFFPELKQWVDPDLSHVGDGGQSLMFPSRLEKLITPSYTYRPEVWLRKAA